MKLKDEINKLRAWAALHPAQTRTALLVAGGILIGVIVVLLLR